MWPNILNNPFSYAQSDSDSSRTNGRSSTGVAKPPGAQIRYATYVREASRLLMLCVVLQAARGWLAGLEAQLYTRGGCRRFVQHHAEALHGRFTGAASVSPRTLLLLSR